MPDIKTYRKKPVQIQALQLSWGTWNEMCDFAPVGDVNGCRGVYVDDDGNWSDDPDVTATLGLLIPTLEGEMLAVDGDYIIRGIQGEFYPCKPDIFEASYEEVEADA